MLDRSYPRPLVLLWGDTHHDDSGMCTSCSCSADEKKCCYTIYDKTLLKEFDALAAQYPVDFYTESSPRVIEESDKDILFRRFLHDTTHACHDKPLRSKKVYESKCPTKNIRWHHSDPRWMDNMLERYVFVDMYIILNDIQIQGVWNYIRTFPGNPHQYLYEALHVIHDVIHHKKETPDPLYHHLQPIGLALYHSFHKTILSDEPFPEQMSTIFTTYVNQAIQSPYSIFKQFRGIKNIPSLDLGNKEISEFLTSNFLKENSSNCKPYLDSIQKLSAHSRMYLRYVLSYPTMNVMFTSPEDGQVYSLAEMSKNEVIQMANALESLEYIILFYKAFFVELYMLFRMLKSPKDNSVPYLSMGFFGKAHVSSLSTLLHDFGYEVSFQTSRMVISLFSTDMRCMTIDQPLLLTQDLAEHALALRALGPSLQQYHKVLKDEQWSRNTEEFRAMENPLEGGKIRRGRKAKTKTKTKKRRTHRRRRSTTR